MKYKVLDVRRKTIEKLGKDVLDVSLKAEDGTQTDNVQIWQGFPGFDSITFDCTVEGDITVKQSGNYTNKTLYPPKAPTGGFKGGMGGIKAAQERKADMIEKAQDRKSESIAYFNAINTAIEFVSTFKDILGITNSAMAYQLVLKYRDDFIKDWQKYESTPF